MTRGRSVDRDLFVPPPGPHGGDGPAIARALGLDPGTILDLSQTLNPFAPPIGPVVTRHLDSLGHYPDAAAATAALAGALGTDPARVLVTNGGAEAIALVAAELGGRPAEEPDFGLYPRLGEGPRWRSDPHSPSGRLHVGCGAVGEEPIAVWDEAFYPLATGAWTAGRDGGGVVTVGSLTKTFACPGLRVGYLVADDVARFAVRQPHWAVSSLALATVPDLVAAADLVGWARRIADNRADLAALLTDHGIPVRADDAPWVLAEAPGLRTRLATRGVIVRDCASFGLAGTVRVAVPDDDGLARLATALETAAA